MASKMIFRWASTSCRPFHVMGFRNFLPETWHESKANGWYGYDWCDIAAILPVQQRQCSASLQIPYARNLFQSIRVTEYKITETKISDTILRKSTSIFLEFLSMKAVHISRHRPYYPFRKIEWLMERMGLAYVFRHIAWYQGVFYAISRKTYISNHSIRYSYIFVIVVASSYVRASTILGRPRMRNVRWTGIQRFGRKLLTLL